MADYSTIKAAIAAKMATITEIRNVYNYRIGTPAGFPFATISRFAVDNIWATNKTNDRKWTFTIRVYQEMDKEGKGASGADTIIDAIADKIFGAFDDDWTLGGVVDGLWIEGGDDFADEELMMRILEIRITCRKLYTLS